MTEVFFELHDENGVVHGRFQLKFGNEISSELMTEKIRSVWRIDEEFQRLYVKNGNEIVRIEEKGLSSLSHGSKIIVKHSDLPRWVQYRNCVEEVKKLRSLQETAQNAMRHHQLLMDNFFFDTYTEFETYRRKHQPELATVADGGLELMARAANRHFLVRHGLLGGTSVAGFKYDIEPKSKTEIMAHVQLHGETNPTKYSLKCLHHGPSSKRRWFSGVVIEMFTYKVLEVLGVGPAVQFILDSKEAMYIASTRHDDFVRISETDTFDIKMLIQLRLLNALLFIGNLHEHNCGQRKSTNTVTLIDTIPLPHAIYENAKRAVRAPMRLAWNYVPRESLPEYPEEKIWDIVKEVLKEWNLLKRVEHANELITAEKEHMKKLVPEVPGFDRSYLVTEELDEHLDAIKTNVEKLQEELGI